MHQHLQNGDLGCQPQIHSPLRQSADCGAAVLQWARLMQERMGSIEPDLGAGWLLKHPKGQADHLHQPVQPLRSHQIQRRLLAAAARHRGLRKGQQWLQVCRLEMQVLT